MKPDGGTLVLDITTNGVFYGINNAQNRSMPHSINPNTARRNQGADMKTGLVEDNPQNNMATNLPTMWHRPTSMPPPSSRRLTGRLRCRGVGAGLLRTIHGFTYFLWSGFIWDIGNLVFSPNLLSALETSIYYPLLRSDVVLKGGMMPYRHVSGWSRGGVESA